MSENTTSLTKVTKPRAEEVMESLTGHDEKAIATHFGRNVADLTNEQTTLGRVLIFTLKRREDGFDDFAAYNAAMDMTLKEVTTFFVIDDEDDADQESGKDETSPGPQLVTSPLSAS